MDYAMIITEGPHDQAFIQRLLKVAFDFRLFDGGDVRKLDSFWRPLIPQYPPLTGNLYPRLPMPSIVSSDQLSVAIIGLALQHFTFLKSLPFGAFSKNCLT
ncbi:MAG: hypothetical protein QME81_13760 [bacterium]|nr:hypothetical protein [bacterium]